MQQEKSAVKISSSVAFLLLLVKFITGFISGSIAVFSSALDSLLDLFVSLFNLIALKNASKPADETFNYGREKFEALASFLEWLIITLSGLYILYESLVKIICGDEVSYLGSAIFVMIFSVIMTGGLVLYLSSIYKKTKNIVIEADTLHYKTDLFTNAGILISLIVISLTGWYIIDAIVGIIIAFYIIYSAYEILKKWFLFLLDVSLPSKQFDMIRKLILAQEEIQDYHFLKTRRTGKRNFVQGHLVFKDASIKLIDAHAVSDRIESQIMTLDKEKEWIIDFHLDPYDDRNVDKESQSCPL